MAEFKKLELLNSAMPIIELFEEHDQYIIKRGSKDSDELSDHYVKFQDYCDGQIINIDTLLSHINGNKEIATTYKLLDLYDSMIADENAAILIFVCRKELKDILDPDVKELTPEHLAKCDKVYHFMVQNKKHMNCITKSSRALSLLIRVYWMLVTGKKLNPAEECQSIAMELNQWKLLYDYCQKYMLTFGDTATHARPVYILLYALSIIQVNNGSSQAFESAYKVLSAIEQDSFNTPYRMRAPFIICEQMSMEEKSVPICRKYSGKIKYLKEGRAPGTKSGSFLLNGVKSTIENTDIFRFYSLNIGNDGKSLFPNKVFTNSLEIGIGYTGFQLYTESGRMEKRKRQ